MENKTHGVSNKNVHIPIYTKRHEYKFYTHGRGVVGVGVIGGGVGDFVGALVVGL